MKEISENRQEERSKRNEKISWKMARQRKE
jgi:hypothetical protein